MTKPISYYVSRFTHLEQQFGSYLEDLTRDELLRLLYLLAAKINTKTQKDSLRWVQLSGLIPSTPNLTKAISIIDNESEAETNDFLVLITAISSMLTSNSGAQ